ncbi:MAG: TonB family protein [Deltaproteobacteria bacterium]|nr:TonB family protein [Deltaproteobacteria bacterium]
MIDAQVQTRPAGSTGIGGIAVTLAIHGALILLFWLGHRVTEPPAGEARDLIATELVKLGKPREKFWLPKISQPKPTKKVEEIKIAEDPAAEAAPQEAPKPEDAEVSDKLRNALNRARTLRQVPDEDSDEGQLDGIAEGSSAEAITGDAYAGQILALVRRNWHVPVGIISDEEVAKLSAQVRVSVGADGTLSGAAIAKTSGNTTFDDSCIAAVSATGQVPPPPEDKRAAFARGVALLFKK